MNDPITRLNKALAEQNKLLKELKASLEAYQKLMEKWAGKWATKSAIT